MRIAIYENLPLGGARRASYELGRRLCRAHDVDLYRLSAYASSELDLAPSVENVHVAPYRPLLGLLGARVDAGHLAPRSYTMFGPLKRLHRKLATQIDSTGYDVVLAHTDAMTQSPYLLRWITRTPTVYYCEEVVRAAYERSILEQHHQKLASSGPLVGRVRLLEDGWVLPRWVREDFVNARAAGTIVVNSRYSRDRVWAAYARAATVCHLGIDPDRFRPGSDAGAARQPELLSIGHPIEAKGHLLAVDALAELPAGPDRPRLRVLLPRGDGTERLERHAARRGVELAIEVGVGEEALVERYRSAVATICAARLEPFGLTAIESMACGTPVIAIREGGYLDSVVDGRTGLLVEPEAGDLARAIGALWHDRRRAAEMGRAGRDHVVAGWSWDASACRLESILRAAAAAVPGHDD